MATIKTHAIAMLGTVCLGLSAPALSSAQTSQQGRVGLAADIATASQYMFRGVRQNGNRMVIWPSVDLRLRTNERSGAVQGLDLHGGFWNSLHTGDTGAGGPTGNPWYEADVYGTFGLHFARGVETSATYTAYRSPNDLFTDVNELSVKATIDDETRSVSFHPYALAAFELDTKPGIGQVDGGAHGGRYLELGAAPGRSLGAIALALPVRVGFSIGNYYELAGNDHPFGFVSVAGVVTMRIAHWMNVHGGVEYEHLGTTTKAFNGGDAAKTIASVGVGFAR